jgi:hypothetical protein
MLVEATSLPIRIIERDFDVGAFLKGGDLDIDAQAASIGVGRGG